MNKSDIFAIILIAGEVVIIATLIHYYLIGIESCNMRFENYREAHQGVTGIYYHDKYFCVWVEGRSEEDIHDTTCHELFHHYTHTNYEHWCSRGKE